MSKFERALYLFCLALSIAIASFVTFEIASETWGVLGQSIISFLAVPFVGFGSWYMAEGYTPRRRLHILR